MQIGIIGTGNMGRTLGLRWAALGHHVLFGSRDVTKAAAIAQRAGTPAQAGDADAAATFGDVVLYTARGALPSALLRAPAALAGKIVIDCNNSDFDAERGEFAAAPVPAYAEQLARDVPGARVVQAFNTLPSRVLELPRERLSAHRISLFACSDDDQAKRTVIRLGEELGLVGVDGGGLVRARIIDGVVDCIRFQVAGMGRGPLTTISLHTLVEEA
jgi:predicted dinucleotide-binding enzyme